MTFSPLATKHATELMHTVFETQSKMNGISDPTKSTGVLQSLSFGEIKWEEEKDIVQITKALKAFYPHVSTIVL